MENESKTCSVCSIPYDTNDHTPRILINCGHTLCSSCLDKIINTPSLRKCPLDNIPFDEMQGSLDRFPLNFALLALLEGKKQNTCQIHDKKLVIICLQDKVKICYDCALFGEHKWHNIKKIKELKAKGNKVKSDLEESLENFRKSLSERDLDVERLKMEIFGTMGSQFEEIKNALGTKELEWQKDIEILFERNIEKTNGVSLKDEGEKALEGIDQACQREENLALLDEDFSSIISSLNAQVGKEEISKISDETSKMMGCIGSFVASQVKSIKDFELSKELSKEIIKPEQPVLKEKDKQEEVSSKDLMKVKKELRLTKSILTFGICLITLKICVKDGNRKNQIIDLDEFNKMKRVNIEFQQYDSLFQKDSGDLTALSEILQQLDNYASLVVQFQPPDLTNIRALTLLNHIFPRIQHLTEIDIYFEGCKIANQPISFFCSEILPKATSLKCLTLRLGSTKISNFDISPLNTSLETFRFEAGETEITDVGMEKILGVINPLSITEGEKSLMKKFFLFELSFRYLLFCQI